MTKSEKRYFKLNASTQGKESEYILIFDEVVKMKEYDEARLIQNLKKRAELKNLPVKKKYLYDALLNSLQDFHREKKTEHELLSLLNHILITYNKGLYGHSEQLIEKGLKLSRSYFKFNYELIFIQWKRDLVNHLQNTKIKEDMSSSNVVEIVRELESDESAILDMLAIDSESCRLYSKATLIIRFGLFEEMDNVIAEITDFRERHKDTELSFFTTMRISRAEGIVLFALRDLEEHISVLRESIRLWEENPAMIRENAQEYILNLNNYLVASIESQQDSNCEAIFEKLRTFMSEDNKHTTNIEKTRAFAFYQYNILKYHNTRREHQLTIKNFEEKRFDHLGLKLNSYKRTQIIHELIVAHFFLNDYRAVVRRSLKTFANYENYQTEVLSQIRNFFYLAHFYRNNIEILEQRLFSKDSLSQGWFKEFPQEKEFLTALIAFSREEIRRSQLIDLCRNYEVKVNPHFKHYLNLWVMQM
ncbi:hypothetical protein JYT74_02745 [Crocinitomix catalasitica]|nr:hypothetical protein [Crocinitomix catalasitica]